MLALPIYPGSYMGMRILDCDAPRRIYKLQLHEMNEARSGFILEDVN